MSGQIVYFYTDLKLIECLQHKTYCTIAVVILFIGLQHTMSVLHSLQIFVLSFADKLLMSFYWVPMMDAIILHVKRMLVD